MPLVRVTTRNDIGYDIRLLPVLQHLKLLLQNYVEANIGTWQLLALSSDQSHFLFSYGNESSSALMYNLFSDLLLGTNIVPQSVRIMNYL